MFYYPRSKVHNQQSVRWFKDLTEPCREHSERQTEPMDWEDCPLTPTTPDIMAPLESPWAARGMCPQEMTFPNTLLWRSSQDGPSLTPLSPSAKRGELQEQQSTFSLFSAWAGWVHKDIRVGFLQLDGCAPPFLLYPLLTWISPWSINSEVTQWI